MVTINRNNSQQQKMKLIRNNKDNNSNTISVTSTTHLSSSRTDDPEKAKLLVQLDHDNNNIFYRQNSSDDNEQNGNEGNDTWNYALLIVLYTLQGIPMGLSASIPFLIQQKVRYAMNNPIAASTILTGGAEATMDAAAAGMTAAAAAAASKLSYNANAIFALCSWPFSLKLLWAPIVDACFIRSFGRRKTWLVPVQTTASLLMIFGSKFVESQLGLDNTLSSSTTTTSLSGRGINVNGLTAYFFVLYFLMATQDIAVDGWALTLLQKKNRGRGPVCNSIGQNIGYLLSFVGFLAFNDIDSCEMIWRPLLRLPSNPSVALVSLGSFLQFMGYIMLSTTIVVAIFKHENDNNNNTKAKENAQAVIDPFKGVNNSNNDDEDEKELDASEIGLRETYHRLWAVCKLPAVRWLFLVLLTYRLPTALSDNVKFLKAVEYGLSKSTTALLSPTVMLPLAILVPIVASKYWNNKPLKQFMSAYKIRTTLVPIVDILMLLTVRNVNNSSASLVGKCLSWFLLIASTELQSIVSSLQFNAQMTFFAKRVDPAIGGSYMTLLNTAANLGGTWPASFTMWLLSQLSSDPQQKCNIDPDTGIKSCIQIPGRDPYFVFQLVLSILGCIWIFVLGKRVHWISELPDEAWRTHILDEEKKGNESSNSETERLTSSVDVELGDAIISYRPHHIVKTD